MRNMNEVIGYGALPAAGKGSVEENFRFPVYVHAV